jgi:lipopolysaccharide export system permease protein
MRTLHRYIVSELVGAFTLWVMMLTLVLVLVVVAAEAIRMNLGLGPTLRLLPFVLPTALSIAVPTALLFATCIVYGRMSADNEIVATKALGITPLELLWPAWTVAFLLSLLGVWLNDLAYSWGAVGVQRVVVQSLEEVAYGMLRTQRSFANPRFSIIVKDVQGRRLIRPFMKFQAHNDLPAIMISAAEAELRSDLKRDTMTLILTDCEIEMEPSIHSAWPGRIEQEYPLSYFSAKDMKSGSPAQLPLRQIRGETVSQQERIHELEQSLAASTALALVTGEIGDLSEATWRLRRKELNDSRNRLFRLQTEPWRRAASGFSALCFVLVGAPLAIRFRKADVMTTFGLVFAPILFVYYPLFMGCCDRAKAGAMPPYIVWAPNVLLAIAGLWMLKKVIRY